MNALPASLEIQPAGPLQASVEIPGSKSYTNRGLLIAALAEGTSVLRRALHSDDTHYMIQGLTAFGIDVSFEDDPRRTRRDTKEGGGSLPFPAAVVSIQRMDMRDSSEGADLRVQGAGGRLGVPADPVFLGNAGTAVRFLTTLSALAPGRVELTGVERMQQRPIQDLIEALRGLGIQADTLNRGCPPVLIQGGGIPGGRTTLCGSASSQYLSSILLSAPYAATDVQVQIEGELASKPYVDMTIEVMRAFGVEAAHQDYRIFTVAAGQRYCAREYFIEADASNASYFLAAAAVTGGDVTVRPIPRRSAQGDLRLLDLLEAMGCKVSRGEDWVRVRERALKGIDADMNALPDMVQTLAIVAAFAETPTHLRNVPNLRIKETDRLTALSTELRKLGAQVDEHPDGLSIYPGSLHGAEIETYDDHRMAMSFAVAGLVVPGVILLRPGCVSKTFPDFFKCFDAMCGQDPLCT